MKKLIDKYGFKISPLSIFLLFICLGVNILLKQLCSLVSVPFYFDSLGTCFSAAVFGPVAGCMVGFSTNIIFALAFDMKSMLFAIVNITIGISVSYSTRKGCMNSLFGLFSAGLVTSLITICLSAPICGIFYNFAIGNEWGAALYDMLSTYNFGKYFSLVCAEAFVNIPDQVITLSIVYVIYNLSKINIRLKAYNERRFA